MARFKKTQFERHDKIYVLLDVQSRQIIFLDTPSQPGTPQVVDVDVDNVTLVWLRPDRNGDAGVLHGYQIHYRPIGELHWHVANTEIVTEPLYTSKRTNV